MEWRNTIVRAAAVGAVCVVTAFLWRKFVTKQNFESLDNDGATVIHASCYDEQQQKPAERKVNVKSNTSHSLSDEKHNEAASDSKFSLRNGRPVTKIEVMGEESSSEETEAIYHGHHSEGSSDMSCPVPSFKGVSTLTNNSSLGSGYEEDNEDEDDSDQPSWIRMALHAQELADQGDEATASLFQEAAKLMLVFEQNKQGLSPTSSSQMLLTLLSDHGSDSEYSNYGAGLDDLRQRLCDFDDYDKAHESARSLANRNNVCESEDSTSDYHQLFADQTHSMLSSERRCSSNRHTRQHIRHRKSQDKYIHEGSHVSSLNDAEDTGYMEDDEGEAAEDTHGSDNDDSDPLCQTLTPSSFHQILDASSPVSKIDKAAERDNSSSSNNTSEEF